MAILFNVPTGYVQKSLVRIDQIMNNDSFVANEWMVTVIFVKGRSDVYVKGFGKSKEEAISDFLAEMNEL